MIVVGKDDRAFATENMTKFVNEKSGTLERPMLQKHDMMKTVNVKEVNSVS